MSDIPNSTKSYRIYKGPRPLEGAKLAPKLDHPDGYLVPDRLVDAVNVALILGKPLLITGEPGTGKTQLAYSIAQDLKLGVFDKARNQYLPYHFTAKHNSVAKDLLYTYDSLQHFSEANQAKAEGATIKKAAEFIRFEALGEAIRQADPDWSNTPKRSVVLIDEIDKAPREFPNDLLRELEEAKFTVPETGEFFRADRQHLPIVVITSNAEKILPDAFLRRCTYFHINFPSQERLRQIVKRRLKDYSGVVLFSDSQITFLLDHFMQIRELCRKKRPATSDLLNWLQILAYYDEFDINKIQLISQLKEGERHLLMTTYSVLVKNVDDFERVISELGLQV